MRFRRTSKVIGVAAVAALSVMPLAACGGGSSNSDGGGNGDEGIVLAYGGEPQNALMPANTGEVFGGRVVQQIFEGLISYDESGKSVNELAESIDTSDNQKYTIKIKSGQKFTDGEALTAKSFVDAWNFAANSKNKQKGSDFFESIAGYKDVSADNPTAETMSGLKVVDDTTFTVELAQAESDFPTRLGYSAYMPLPAKALEDPEKFGKSPIGNGPYKFKSDDAWETDKQISLVKNPDYTGTRKPKNDGITFKFYTTTEPAYTDIQAGNLDVMDGIPAGSIKTAESELSGRYSNKPSAWSNYLNFPGNLPEYQGEAGKLRKQAISMAINREEIIDVIYNKTRTVSTDFTSSTLPGYSSDLPGSDILKFDATKAKQLWEQANQIQPWDSGKILELNYNTDGAGNKEFIDAVANQLKNNLGINAAGKAYAQFKELLNDRLNQKITGPTRSAWKADYPSIYNFLAPQWATNGGSNYEKYSNPEFDKLLRDGAGSKDQTEAAKKYNQAQEIMLKDLPSIPLWETNQTLAWSEKVSGVTSDWSSDIVYYKIEKKK